MLRQPARAMLIDLDGVVRRWDPTVAAGVESTYGLEPGTLMKTAFAWELLRPAVAGEMTDAEWMGLIAQRLPLDEAQARAAVTEWQKHRGTVDPEVLTFIREVRAAGRPVGLATNATDLLRGDLETLGLTHEFDTIISSTELKIHKPAPDFFARAAEALDEQPPWVLFVDDDDRVIRGARAAKLPAFRWTGPQDILYLKKALGIS
ncbi:HAD family hydrolase [Winogradskya humida]|uniref:Haloacid dehalogenase n=1 Tax=Winogradskya humida TaxID=113566 RepID=A0ABQ3ZSD4_9ACTN|nr:HAD-IA family hydrolase [Actinoplanes humidus]GIE21471.1 haloacid dehalogenase [Actinoplanes humidus]